MDSREVELREEELSGRSLGENHTLEFYLCVCELCYNSVTNMHYQLK